MGLVSSIVSAFEATPCVLAVADSVLGPVATGASNVAILDGFAYTAVGPTGIVVTKLEDGYPQVATVAPPGASARVDSLAAAGRLLFALDGDDGGWPVGNRPGYLSVFAIDGEGTLSLVSGPTEVPVGPFSTVGAAAGKAVVSGGNKALTVYSYDQGTGQLGSPHSVDLARSQPSVVVHPEGELAFVQTWFAEGTPQRAIGEGRGTTVIRLFDDAPPTTVSRIAATPQAKLQPELNTRFANFGLQVALYMGAAPKQVMISADVAGLHFTDVTDASSLPLDPPVELESGGRRVKAQGIHLGDLSIEKAVNVAVAGDWAFVVGGGEAKPTLTTVDISGLRNNGPVGVVTRSTPLPKGSLPVGVAADESFVAVAATGANSDFFTRSEVGA